MYSNLLCTKKCNPEKSFTIFISPPSLRIFLTAVTWSKFKAKSFALLLGANRLNNVCDFRTRLPLSKVSDRIFLLSSDTKYMELTLLLPEPLIPPKALFDIIGLIKYDNKINAST